MHACNMQHSHLHKRARNTHASMQHTTHNKTHMLPLSVKDYTYRDLHIDQEEPELHGIINAQK